MPRPKRVDFRGAWLHVMVRALAKRPLFEGSRDVRDFLAGIAKAVRRGDLEVHAFSVLTTHAHLLVRSPRGTLSTGLRDALSEYVLRFNRRRGRDGPLLRGRFHSKVIRSDAYWYAVVRYIDQNAPTAGLSERGDSYVHSSRFHYARRKGPPWLSRERIEAEVRALSCATEYSPKDYPRAFGGSICPEMVEFIDRAVVRGDRRGSFDDLVGRASGTARQGFEERTVLAEGASRSPLLAPAALIRDVVAVQRALQGSWQIRGERKSFDGWTILETGLLHALAGESQERLTAMLAVSRSTLREALARHARLVRTDPGYGARARAVLASVREELLVRSGTEHR